MALKINFPAGILEKAPEYYFKKFSGVTYVVYNDKARSIKGPYWAATIVHPKDPTPEELEIAMALTIARFGGRKRDED